MTSVQENIRLAPLTTLGVGGPARFFVEASSEDAVLEAVAFAERKGVQFAVVGGGSNLLVSDDGVDGLVVRVALARMEFDESGGVRAGAGEAWDPFVAECVRRDLAGVECLSGIPGWVGGTPVQNVGAYGQEVAPVIESVRVYDRETGGLTDLSRAQCRFQYRASVFNAGEPGRYIVLSVRYALSPGGRPSLEYADLERYFTGIHGEPTLAEARAAVLAIRRSKAMVLEPNDPDCRSAGSFFRNPIATPAELERVEGIVGPDIPRYRLDDGRSKIPAAWLIEHAGFGKGTTDGSVGLSSRHALVLINRGDASSADVVRFAGRIRDAVADRFGIGLEAEPAFLGFDDVVRTRFGARKA